MKLNWLAFAVPLFVSFMILEYYVSKKRNKTVHRFEETIANLNVGIAERLCDLLTTGAFFLVFAWVEKNFAIFQIKPTALTWILLFVATDFVWYWYHRFGHEVNLFWSVHVVHHQSEDFNYTASVRVTVLQAAARGIFWSVLPLIGFPAEMICILLLIHGTYPFFTHTRLIAKLGWIEYLFVTPSHHRVHHSSDEKYLDKNYGDVLIIWDKMFGTFAKEEEEPSYGLTTSLNSYSFLWQHFHFMLEMIIAFKRAVGWKNKIKIVFGKPENIDPRIRPYLERKLLSTNTAVTVSPALSAIIKSQTILTLFILFFTILFEHYFYAVQLYVITAFILLSVINTGAMLEQKQWVFNLDFVRLALIGFFVYSVYPYPAVSLLVFIALSFILLFYRSCRHYYYSFLYNNNVAA